MINLSGTINFVGTALANTQILVNQIPEFCNAPGPTIPQKIKLNLGITLPVIRQDIQLYNKGLLTLGAVYGIRPKTAPPASIPKTFKSRADWVINLTKVKNDVVYIIVQLNAAKIIKVDPVQFNNTISTFITKNINPYIVR